MRMRAKREEELKVRKGVTISRLPFHTKGIGDKKEKQMMMMARGQNNKIPETV